MTERELRRCRLIRGFAGRIAGLVRTWPEMQDYGGTLRVRLSMCPFPACE
jgi:hypothetical protein